MILPDDAWALIKEHTTPLPPVTLPLDAAPGYALAQDIRADRDIPAANRSAMDGYCLRSEDLNDCPVTLTVISECAAGDSRSFLPLSPNTCIRIFTGANVPPDADTVIKQEDVQDHGDGTIIVESAPKKGTNILRRGENGKEGDLFIKKGTLLSSTAIGVCAAVGNDPVQVHDKPTVGILSTGKELLDADQTPDLHQLRNSNGPTLAAALKLAGFDVCFSKLIPDDADEIKAALEHAVSACDVVILTGGVSVGKYDLVPAVIKDTGASIIFHKVAMKPGKPQLFAKAVDGTLIFGLPGNPLSSLMGLHEFVLPALKMMAGWSPELCRPTYRLPLGEDVLVKGTREYRLLVRTEVNGNGTELMPVTCTGSADLIAAAGADGTAILPPSETTPRGAYVDYRPWRHSV